MSHYLVERIKAQPNIEVVTRCEMFAESDSLLQRRLDVADKSLQLDGLRDDLGSAFG